MPCQWAIIEYECGVYNHCDRRDEKVTHAYNSNGKGWDRIEETQMSRVCVLSLEHWVDCRWFTFLFSFLIDHLVHWIGHLRSSSCISIHLKERVMWLLVIVDNSIWCCLCYEIFLTCLSGGRTRTHPSSIIKSDMMMPATAPPPIAPDLLVLDLLSEFGWRLFDEFVIVFIVGLADGLRKTDGATVGDLL